jgi:hypothetical protein
MRRVPALQSGGRNIEGFTFADGHAEIHRFRDPKIKPKPVWNKGTILNYSNPSPNGRDITCAAGASNPLR